MTSKEKKKLAKRLTRIYQLITSCTWSIKAKGLDNLTNLINELESEANDGNKT